jgi:hypothetical protein
LAVGATALFGGVDGLVPAAWALPIKIVLATVGIIAFLYALISSIRQ